MERSGRMIVAVGPKSDRRVAKMPVFCVSCGKEVWAGLVNWLVCPCGSRCFQWDDQGLAGYVAKRDERERMGGQELRLAS